MLCEEFHEVCNSTIQLIQNSRNEENQESFARGSRLTRSLTNIQDPLPVHRRRLSLDNSIDENLSINDQYISSTEYDNSNSNLNSRWGTQGVYIVPILPNYSTQRMDQYYIPCYPPPEYPPPPPRYDAIINNIDHIDDEEFHFEVAPTTFRMFSLYDRRSSASTGLTTTTTTNSQDRMDFRYSETTFLACIVFWFCGFLFGGLAIFFSVMSKSCKSQRKFRAARIFSNASYFFSISGFMIGFFLIVVVIIFLIGSMYKKNSCVTNLCWG